MKKIISIILMTGLLLQPLNITFANSRYGEYADYETASPGDVNAGGPLYYPDAELMYDFDSDAVPQGVTASGGNISISDEYYIALTSDRLSTSRSLKWDTTGTGSTLTFDTNGFYLYNDGFWGTGTLYNYSVAVFRDSQPRGGTIPEFSFVLNTDCGTFSYPITLYDEGWNFLNQQIERDKMKPNCKVTSILLKQTAGTDCEIYIDNLLIAMGAEVRGLEEPYIGRYITQEDIEIKYPVHDITQSELEAFRLIESKVLPKLSPISELSDEKLSEYKEFYEFWCISLAGTKFANGLYPSYYYNTVPGTANSDGYGGTAYPLGTRATEFCQMFKNICRSYAALRNQTQKEILYNYIVGLGRLALTYDNIPEAWYSGQGFAEGCYYGKEALEKVGILDDLYARLKKQYGIDKILYMNHVWGNESAEDMKASADEFINNYSSNLIVLLMAADSPEKARDFYRFKSFLDNVMYQFSPGTNGTFKPDGTLFHHGANKYDYGWKDAYNNGITLYPYYLSDTVFALSEETLERIEMINDVRFKTADPDCRVGTADQISVIDSKGLMFLSKVSPFNPKYAAQWMYFGAVQDDALRNEYIDKGITAPPSPNTNVTLPYASVNIHRRNNWKVQTYGNNNLTYFSEYVRPAFIFYNLGGMAVTENGECPAIQNDAASSVDGRHGFDLSPGYNVNRAPGVTAPEVDPKQCEQPSHQSGSSAFVGGVSAKNGNGVFTNQFDLSQTKNPIDYSKTGITDLKFKKSYFYFDDKILCMGSDIGCSNTELTTGVMQEKTDDSEVIQTSDENLSGEFNMSVSSNDKQWIIDNKNKAGYYFFPNQTYTLTKGEQSFVYSDEANNYTGNFAGAYINHNPEEVINNTSSYAYVVLPKADGEKMQEFAETQSNSQPQLEIVQMDKNAHIARDNRLDITGYVIFDSNVKIQNCDVIEVESPSVIMTKKIDDGKGLSLAVADPDLRISDKVSDYSGEKEISVTLKGKWRFKESTNYLARKSLRPKTELMSDGNTIVTVSCKDGLTNEYLLENMDKPLLDDAETLIFNKLQNSVKRICNNKLVNMRLSRVLIESDNTTFISLSDIDKLFGTEFGKNDGDAGTESYYRSKKINFTYNSNAVLIDGKVEALEQNTLKRNNEMYIPLSAVSLVFGYDMLSDGDETKFTYNDAVWKAWDKEYENP